MQVFADTYVLILMYYLSKSRTHRLCICLSMLFSIQKYSAIVSTKIRHLSIFNCCFGSGQ